MTPAAHIALRNVSVRFPVLSFRDRSLRSRFVNGDDTAADHGDPAHRLRVE
ncbi:hypothetical protein ACVWZK_005675 [Bradyrhizobium sp. GM0.4]